jgi:hypothetical protein
MSTIIVRENLNNRSDIKLYLMFFIGIAIIAYIYTPDDNTDAFLHYLNAVNLMKDFNLKSLFLNIWDKPIPLILYGLGGSVDGIFTARLVSILITLLGAFLTLELVRARIPGLNKIPESSSVIFLLIMPVALNSFVTMTELICGFLLALSLNLFFLRHKNFSSFFIAGLMPLSRVESSVIMASLIICYLFILKNEKHTRLVYLLSLSITAIAPLFLWLGISGNLSGDYLWLVHSGYSFLRPYNLEQWSMHNGITALPSILVPTALYLFIYAIFSLRSAHLNFNKDNQLITTTLIVFASFVILVSSIIAYPKGEINWVLLIPAINGRVYNSIAPLLAILIYFGIAKFQEDAVRGANLIYIYIKLIFIFIIGVFLIYICEKQFRINGSNFSKHYNIYLLIFIITSIIFSILLFKKNLKIKSTIVNLMIVAGFILINPDFWEPTKFNDPLMRAQDELTSYISENYKNQDLLVIQNYSGSVEYFIGNKKIHAPWDWPSKFQRVAESSNGHFLIAIKTIGNIRKPTDDYPPDLILYLSGLKKIKESEITTPYGWVLYQK